MTESAASAANWVMHPAEVAVFDRNAEALGLTVSELMRAAGTALADCAADLLKSSCGEAEPQKRQKEPGKPGEKRPICFLCGPGNNGGDGYAAALRLHERGYPVQLVAGAERQRGAEARAFRKQCVQADIPLCIADTTTEAELAEPEQLLRRAGLVVDCLLGAGFSGAAPRGAAAAILRLCHNLQKRGSLAPVLACDMPSGLGMSGGSDLDLDSDSDTTSGLSAPPCLPAVQTLTFHAPKLPMHHGNHADGKLRPEVGRLEIAPLPWPPQTTDCGPGELLRLPPLRPDARKGERGRLLVIGGGPYHGAPLLAAQAAGRSGCDLVHLAMPSQAAARSHWPLFLIPEILPATANADYFDAAGCAHLRQLCEQRHFDAVLLGPGLGRRKETLEPIWELILQLIEMETPLVLDADALYLLAQKCPGRWPVSGHREDHGNGESDNTGKVSLRAMQGIATPHQGELQRWLGTETRPARVLEALGTAGLTTVAEQQVLLCSGSVDELTGHAGRLAHSAGGSPRLACAGTGDVLAGLCGSFLAQGMSPWAAARLSSYLLRQAGQCAAKDMGLGLVADDLPLYIAKYLAKCLAQI
ncbi:NAD(P)H-hydrate dehydratase [Candidatus Haliotispira prima]|uniref:ADP-dependent (S)-NAD(P)H-hydrate dehydratase n=1 Tax=Candidatus Haliotispira prima TaxID=3034016 RepID=A0ABY8MJM4_9SPIO|nr:NAD(P)H-hydrate dehydratase [Candidatus Haliotispira prima]